MATHTQMICWVALLCAVIGACGDDAVEPSAGTLHLMRTSYEVTEGDIVNVFVTRSDGSDGEVSVDYATMDGDAEAGSDYNAASGTLTWPDAWSGNRTISIAIADDNTPEPAESFIVTLSNASGATLGESSSATVNIVDNDSR